ncbi:MULTISPECIES: GDSL-type esterase/lipase family protein [Arthrospira]|jgi:lysophospholipase L1-like esterase|uniref:G-D-S-L family lipolytic protein n=1 Tax=Limnospira platensis NIES-46 TaxID=1236695 RepID=A0A5M3T9S7_LIMPL|nr:GDSL-type esterase/lipase family protein [Arthrospira platensis]AMW31099.1 G-D-S-L family lipolytic protein [Arthrospira platensis YZ]KDR58484.1 G-D-S-L family lipolytic protein [Arthrospira platensis str. Paraca]MBD2669123.1 G-D-S-L family lipolytic protein [Arthrospira platensis FACHB-439]MBD2711058.1 G-D-S-L family lipolytic protein [Arthrospira platensis FACHB-835]MDF2208506.1 GDSL-type esterase/lipase family protein [Arthrospira platensis NCB002]MDT9183482.1 GDSL-type esterase/lipase 
MIQAVATTKFAPTHTKHTPLRIIALGDSLIYGFGDPVGGGWVEQLRREWMSPEKPGHALYNLGIRGNTVAQVTQRLEQEFRQRGELRNRLPDLIILSVGLNDTPRLGRPNGRSLTDFDAFRIHVATLLERAQSLCPVIFVGMPPVDESKMPFLGCMYYNHADQYAYKEATRRGCEVRDIPYLDIFDLWLSRGEDWVRSQLSSDGLHPNVQGYQSLLKDVQNWEPIANLG